MSKRRKEPPGIVSAQRISNRTLGELLCSLTPGECWKLIVALATVAVLIFRLGQITGR
jgi:hypothetical protein